MKIYQDIKLLWPYITLYRRRQLAGLFGLMLLGAGAELISLGAVVPFIAILSNPDEALSEIDKLGLLQWFGLHDFELGIVVSIAFGFLVALATIIRLLLLWATNRVVFGVGFDLSVAVFSKTLYRPYTWHITRNSSESLGGINKTQTVVQGYLLPLLNGCVAFFLSIAMIGMLIFIDPYVALAGAGAFGFCYFAIALGIRRKLSTNGSIIAQAGNRRLQKMQEGIGGIRDIILDSSQVFYIAKFARIDDEMRNAQATNSFLSNSPRLAIEGIGLVIIAGFALISTRAGSLTDLLPVLGALGLGAQKLMPMIQMIYSAWNSTTSNRQSLNDVLELLSSSKHQIEPKKMEFKKKLVLEDVGYAYPLAKGKKALSEINLEIKKGQVIGVVGQTGSGKSTLVDLLMGLISPTAGQFIVDGKEVKTEEQIRAWSIGVSHVPQTIFLSDCSIKENIALGFDYSQIDDRRLREVARIAEIDSFIEQMEHGYDTEVGERGVKLSGGQRQRIGIARALYRRSHFLVLDEATSALDDETEKKVINNIHFRFPDLTIIMVAHRISTLKNCGYILKLGNGKIIDQVSYGELHSSVE